MLSSSLIDRKFPIGKHTHITQLNTHNIKPCILKKLYVFFHIKNIILGIVQTFCTAMSNEMVYIILFNILIHMTVHYSSETIFMS
jgi:hypothetical protein